ncbi:BCCT family transporter [Lachnospiraceae bacterium 62-35]
MNQPNNTNLNFSQPVPGRIDWITTIIPFLMILFLCASFVLFPELSKETLTAIRFFLGDRLGVYYLIIGLGIFLLSFYIAFSRYGNIRLGRPDEKPKYSTFVWGSMMFTSGLAADIMFYSFCEWILYAQDPHLADMGSIQDWSSTYPIFHWGPIPWSFYLVLAVAFGFMLHVRKCCKQKYSEACRPLLGSRVDRLPGRLIDLLALFALLAGTATTFSLATPLMSRIVSSLLGIPDSKWITISILIITCIVYTLSVVRGMSGIARLAAACIYLFFALLIYVLLGGGETRYIIETGFSAIGNLAQNFFSLATYTDPQRTNSFPQTWTIFYWAYWMVWCVASPFFIGTISRGRTVRQTILGGYVFSLSSTFVSFLILGNYGLGLQVNGRLDVLGFYDGTSEGLYATIISIINTLPFPILVLILLAVTMIAFYATSFDAIALVASSYSYKEISSDEEPHTTVKAFWSIMLILFPIALVFSESSMANLQTVSIIAAFPIGFVIILIIASFFKDASAYLEEQK